MKSDLASIALEERFLLQKEYLGDNKLVNQVFPLVSVTVATYQHVNYIRQCLEGILMQKTNFPYEIIVGEDGSVDGTQDICKEYAEKYPDRIRLFIRDRNLSQFVAENGKVTRFNGIWNRMSARGKYIAWCEGDDYWIDPLKLQKQVDFLEKHPEYGLCYTKAKVYLERISSFKGSVGYPFSTIDELLVDNKIATLTTCFRKRIYDDYLHEVSHVNAWIMGDYPVWLYFAFHSKIHFLNEESSVYRVLENSASHSNFLIKRIAFCISKYNISKYFVIKYHKKGVMNAIRRHLILVISRTILRSILNAFQFKRKKE